jgi:hypothetical protein
MTNLEAYIQEAESQGSKHCVVPTKTLRALLEVAEAARYVDESQGERGLGTLGCALDKLEEARRG